MLLIGIFDYRIMCVKKVHLKARLILFILEVRTYPTSARIVGNISWKLLQSQESCSLVVGLLCLRIFALIIETHL
jgi:hypothetical protein